MQVHGVANNCFSLICRKKQCGLKREIQSLRLYTGTSQWSKIVQNITKKNIFWKTLALWHATHIQKRGLCLQIHEGNLTLYFILLISQAHEQNYFIFDSVGNTVTQNENMHLFTNVSLHAICQIFSSLTIVNFYITHSP